MKDAQNPEYETRGFDWEGMRQRIAAASTTLSGLDETTPEVMQQVWARRAAQLAQVPVQGEESKQIELVLVQLGREIYGFDARYVYDVRPVEQIARVPRVPDWVAGVVNLRGRILSVLDLQRFFGLAEGNVERDGLSAYLMVVETSDMEIALLADDILAVEASPASQVREVSDTIRGIRPEYVHGVTERRGGDVSANGDGLLVVLNLPALLADERLEVLSKSF